MPFQFKLLAASATFFLASSLHHHYYSQKRDFPQSESTYSISASILQAWNGIILPKLVKEDNYGNFTTQNAPIIFK